MARKKGTEAKFERATWFAMVLVFALLRFDRDLSLIPSIFVPIILSLILLFSGIYQISQKWTVSPITWMISVALFLLAITSLYVNIYIDLILLSIGFTVAHILFGIFSNES
ncbi:MAG: hypothetical protein Q9P44_10430 [Anaerolineae bacterium]|nr:hypothetical protein [Anaerolineae bacterium]